MGGATNHRMGLWDAAMIKDNHVAVAGSVGEATARARAAGIDRIIVEVDSLDQIEPALTAGATHLLLDNMTPPTLREAVALLKGGAQVRLLLNAVRFTSGRRFGHYQDKGEGRG